MEAAVPFVPEVFREHVAGLPQLHNDVVDFAVAGGAIGVILYFIFLGIPLIAVFRRKWCCDQFLVRYAIGSVAIIYFFCGLTDLMIGFDFHTGIYIGLSAIILGSSRAERQSQPLYP